MSLQVGAADEGIEALDQAIAASKRILAELVEDLPTLRRSES